MNKKVFIAMSGGVDSSVAAYLMLKEGHECIGATMRLFDKEGSDDIGDARKVCEKLGIDFYVFDVRDEFKRHVIDDFVRTYENCATPNPCVVCNKYLKFTSFWEYAEKHLCDFMVTGHDARIEKENERFLLKKALDSSKDQSYFLYCLNQEQLSHTLFPLGTLTKDAIREIALANNLITARKRDSQDICFVPGGDYASVISEFSGKKYPGGNFVNTKGDVIGTHNGIINYTIGQRKGLGIGFGERVYVCEKRLNSNEVVLGKNKDLFSGSLDADKFNWIAFEKAPSSIRVKAKIRYAAKEEDATVFATSDTTVHIEFDNPQRAIAKGQAVVLYDDDVVIGGGTIM